MRVRENPFPVEAITFIDGLSSDWSITFATAAALKLYGDASAVLAVKHQPGPSTPWHRKARSFLLGEMARSIIEALPPARAAAITATAYPHLVRNATELAPVLASWAFEDQRKGGAMIPFRNRWRCDWNGKPFPRVERRLMSPSWIRRYVKNDEAAIQQRDVFRQFISIERRALDLDPADLMMLTDDLARVHELDARASNVPKAPPTPEERKVMRRSAGIACSVLGDEAVHRLLKGEHHDIVGAEFTFRVKLPYGVRGRGHGQLSVGLMVGAEHLADLCLYYPKTPTLDQVAALALDVAAGDDVGVLRTANLVTLTDAGMVHPAIADKRSFHLRTDNVGRPESEPDRERRLQREYYQRTRDAWLGSVVVFVFGTWRAKGIKRIMLQ